MQRPFLYLASVGLSAAANFAVAQETVTFQSEGQDVVATLSVPQGDPAPVVLLLHGFTGSRDELKTEHVPEGVFGRTAAKLADAGFASLRIDFRGSGESLADLSFADTTFESQITDGLAALGYLKGLDTVDGDDIYVIGWSQGGLVASAVAGRSDMPDALALWAAVATPRETYGSIFGVEQTQAAIDADESEVITLPLPWGVDVSLKGAFFDQVDSFDPTSEIVAYGGPLLVAQGTLDTTVLPASADAFIAAHEGPEALWSAEMDHVFNTFGSSGTLDDLIEVTIDFFKSHDD